MDGCLILSWRAPADDRGVHTYDIRFDTAPVTGESWDGLPPLVLEFLPPDGPGERHFHVLMMPEAGTAYHFAIQAADLAGNRSPVTPAETPARSYADGDRDGMEDGWEISNGLDPAADDSRGDMDGDGLTNGGEHRHESDPGNPDSDGDGHSDGDEARFGSDPGDSGSRPPDLNCDIRTDMADVIVALRLLVSGVTPPEFCPRDVDWDGRIGLPEAILLLQGIAGLRDE